MKRVLFSAVAIFVLVACAPSGPENAARAAFVQWADAVNRVPYQNVQVTTVENDDTFATVKITAEFRADKDAPWVEQEAKTKCKKVGQEWLCAQVFSLTPTARGIVTATASAQAAQVSATATAQAVRNQLHSLGEIALAGNDGIYVMDSDGSNLHQISTERAYVPAWSPDGQRIAYSSGNSYDGEIYVMNVDGSSKVRLTNDSFDDWGPTWSSDGKRIAFASSRDQKSGLWIMDSDGRNVHQFTDEYLYNPSWSPDGRFIAGVDGKGIYLLDVATKNARLLADGAWNNSAPSWSPDSSFLVFCGASDYARNITMLYVVDVRTGNKQEVETKHSCVYSLAWSPDGNWIAFASDGIFVTDKSGKNVLQLMNNSSIGGYLAWSPKLNK